MRIAGGLDYCIRRNEPSQLRIIVPRPEVDESGLVVGLFAGEVVLETVSGIFAFLFPLPFLLLEVVVGVVQALVFAMLTLAFMIILTTPHHEESKEVSH